MIHADDPGASAWAALAALPPDLVAQIFEAVVEETYTRVLGPGDWALDVGAHRGRHTVPMARLVGPLGRVVAVEAASEMRPKLEAVISRCGVGDARRIVEIHGVAAWDEPGEAEFFFVPEAAGMSGLRVRDYPRAASPRPERVRLARLDDLVDRPGLVRFVKLDIEGAEYHALLGAPRILAEGRPVLAFEFGNRAMAETYGYGRDAFFELFDRADYDLYTATGTRMTRADWGRDAPYYLVALPMEDRAAFERVLLPSVLSAIGGEVAERLNRESSHAVPA